MMMDTARKAGRHGAAAEMHDSDIYHILYMLEWNLARDAGLGRYRIESIMRGIARSCDRNGSYDGAQAARLMRDYIGDPRKYAAMRYGTPGDPSTDFGTVFTSRLVSQMGRHAEALELVEGDIARNPDGPQSWLSKAHILHGLGRLDEALECAERSLKIRPGNLVAAGLRARILAGMGRYEDALEYAREYPELEKRHFIAAMGLALGGLGDYGEALVYLDVAISEDSNTGDLEEARQAVIEAAGITEAELAAMPSL
ncbi:MAG: tetratricopeptide repeat protein [Nitrosopumilus sp.]|nr:tetratricopeptide repeat protein [Nitrosopumilus sp.]